VGCCTSTPRSPQVQARLAEVRRLVVGELLAQLRSAGPPELPRGAPLGVELAVRTVEHLVHATVIQPPPNAAPDEVGAEIVALAAGYLRDMAPADQTTRAGPG
jgi:hypothetical protein